MGVVGLVVFVEDLWGAGGALRFMRAICAFLRGVFFLVVRDGGLV